MTEAIGPACIRRSVFAFTELGMNAKPIHELTVRPSFRSRPLPREWDAIWRLSRASAPEIPSARRQEKERP